MRIWLTLLLPFLVVGASALEGFDDEEVIRDKYISPSPVELPPQNVLFDRRGHPTLSLKDEKKEAKAKKKKKKKEKRKKLTKKPGKRRPKGYSRSKRKASKTRTRKRGRKRKAPSPPPEEDDMPDAEDDGEGQGFDYGGVSVGDDAKVGVPGSGSDGNGPSFRPSPPQAQ